MSRVAELWIGHWPKSGGASARPDLPGFVFETCLRRLLITTHAEEMRAGLAASPVESWRGIDAYRFLLEVTTGLRSAVRGETNVFGQFRAAWDAHQPRTPELARLVAQAIRDTRAIRSRHLQNLGGASYGPLARRLLRPRDGDRVLFVGAGELARSMLPFFDAFATGTWSRSAPRAEFREAGRVFAPGDGACAAGWATHVIMTTPPDEANDSRWSAWLGASLVQAALLMGHRREERLDLPAHVAGFDLDDVFELRRSQDGIRSLQLARAESACREFALDLARPAAFAPRRAAG